MATQQVISIYGLNFTAEELAERRTWHDTTWIECEIPQALEKELLEIIDKKVEEFEKNCGCGLCKLNNSNPVHIDENLK